MKINCDSTPLLIIWMEQHDDDVIPITGMVLEPNKFDDARLFEKLIKHSSDDWRKENFYIIPLSKDENTLLATIDLLTKFDDSIIMYPESFIISGRELFDAY